MAENSFSLHLSAEMDGELSACAADMKKSKTQVVRAAIAEWLADYADAREAHARSLDPNDETISGAELRRRVGI